MIRSTDTLRKLLNMNQGHRDPKALLIFVGSTVLLSILFYPVKIGLLTMGAFSPTISNLIYISLVFILAQWITSKYTQRKANHIHQEAQESRSDEPLL